MSDDQCVAREREIPFRVWAARRTVRMHAEPPTEDRATGRCAHCGEADPCPYLVDAIRYLLASAGITR